MSGSLVRHRLATPLALALAGCSGSPGHAQVEQRTYFACTLQGGSRSVRLALTGDDLLGLSASRTVATSDLAGVIVTETNDERVTFYRAIRMYSLTSSMHYEVWSADSADGSGKASGGYRAMDADSTVEELPCDPGTLHEDLGTLKNLVDIAQISP